MSGANVTKPPAGAETRWAGVIYMLDWVVKYKVILKAYDTNPVEDTCENPDGSKYGDHMLDDDDWADAEELVSVVIGAHSNVYSVLVYIPTATSF
jgi:hypothetical protein